MHKPNKSVIHVTAAPQLIEDSDELQLLDERNFQWVEAWKAAAKESTELKVLVIMPDKIRLTAPGRKNPTLKKKGK